MAELRGTKSRLIIAEIRRLGGGPLTHEELYRQSPAIQKEFADSIAVSRRLSDLYKAGSFLGRVSQKREGGRKQYAYHYVPPESLPSLSGSSAASDLEKPQEAKAPTLQKARAAMGLLSDTGEATTVVPSTRSRATKTPLQPSTETPRKGPGPETIAGASGTTSVWEHPASATLNTNSESKKEKASEDRSDSSVDPLAHLLTGLFSDLLSQLIEEVAPSLRKALLAAPQTAQVRTALKRAVQAEAYAQDLEEAETGTETLETEETRTKSGESTALRVLVVGLLGQQAETLKYAYRNRIRFQFWNEDRVNDQLKHLIDTSEVVIGATKFISHAVDGVLSRANRYIRVHGGVSKIRLELTKLLREPRPAE